MTTPLLEACVESLDEALAAQNAGAGRIELCARLDLDGITPPAALVEQCVQQLNIPVKVMVRAHGGSFRYSEEELMEMEDSIAKARNAGAFGVVFGFLNSDNTVDLHTTKRFLKVAKGLDLTFHKAIDLTPNPVEAVQQLYDLEKPMTVLSSGGEDTAINGSKTLREMMAAGKDRITILPAGSITSRNWQALHDVLGARAYHGRRIVG